MTADRDWTAEFDRTFAGKPGAEGSVQSRIWMEVLGDEYPVELSPHSYITRTELERFARELELGPADLFADLACGEGGPGLWIARMTGARLVGLDISKVALESAARTSAAMGLADRCRWVEGSFEATGLEHASVDAAMSVDALLFSPDKNAAIREIARIIRPRGRLVFTSFDYTGRPVGRPAQVSDHQPLLKEAGFRILAYEETEDWHHRLKATGDALLAAAGELAAESGGDPGAVEAEVREMTETLAFISRRVFVVAERH